MLNNELVLNNNAMFTLVESELSNSACRAYYYSCNYTVDCESGIVNIEGINIFNTLYEGKYIAEVHVVHNTDYVYGDRAFEEAISKLLGVAVMFTEAGMQDIGLASMELA